MHPGGLEYQSAVGTNLENDCLEVLNCNDKRVGKKIVPTAETRLNVLETIDHSRLLLTLQNSTITRVELPFYVTIGLSRQKQKKKEIIK